MDDTFGNAKSTSIANLMLKTSQERWNQVELGYFDPHFDKAHKESEIMLIGKDVYYRNIVLFVQCLQSLVIFCNVTLVKANIFISFHNSALEWYTSEFNNFD